MDQPKEAVETSATLESPETTAADSSVVGNADTTDPTKFDPPPKIAIRTEPKNTGSNRLRDKLIAPMVAAIVTVIFLPLTTCVSYVINQQARKPAPIIDNVEFGFSVLTPIPDKSSLRLDGLALGTLTAQLGQGSAEDCVLWLGGSEEWNPECNEKLQRAVILAKVSMSGTQGSMASLGKVAKIDGGSLMQPVLDDFAVAYSQLNAFGEYISMLEGLDKPLAGNVTLKLAVVNAGDSDGLLSDRLLVTFYEGDDRFEFHVLADRPVLVRAHDYVRMTYRMSDRYVRGEEEARSRFQELVKGRVQIRTHLTVQMGSQTASMFRKLDWDDYP